MSTAAKDAPNLTAIQYKKSAAPSTPASGYVRAYVKSDGKLYLKDDTGTESAAGATALAGLTTDVAISGPSLGDTLRRGASNWINAPQDLVFATSYGVINDNGASDQTTALQAFFDALKGTSGDFYRAKVGILPPWTIKHNSTLTFTNMWGVELWASPRTILRYAGSTWAINVESCRDCLFTGVTQTFAGGCTGGVQQYGLVTGELIVPTGNHWSGWRIDGGGTAIQYGFSLAGGSGNNNEATTFTKCHVNNASIAHWYFSGFECYANVLRDCEISGSGVGTSAAGVSCNGAIVYLDNCLWGGCTTGIVLTSSNSGGIVLDRCDMEGCGQLLDASSGSYTVTIRNLRYTLNAQADASTLIDQSGGSLILEHCEFVNAQTGTDTYHIIWGGFGVFEIRGCTFCSDDDPVLLSQRLFYGYRYPSLVEGTYCTMQVTPFTAAILAPVYIPQMSGATPTVDPHYHTYVTSNGSATSVTSFAVYTADLFDQFYDGLEFTILIRDANTTFVYSNWPPPGLILNGAVNWSPPNGSLITFVYYQGFWYEKSRMSAA